MSTTLKVFNMPNQNSKSWELKQLKAQLPKYAEISSKKYSRFSYLDLKTILRLILKTSRQNSSPYLQRRLLSRGRSRILLTGMIGSLYTRRDRLSTFAVACSTTNSVKTTNLRKNTSLFKMRIELNSAI